MNVPNPNAVPLAELLRLTANLLYPDGDPRLSTGDLADLTSHQRDVYLGLIRHALRTHADHLTTEPAAIY